MNHWAPGVLVSLACAVALSPLALSVRASPPHVSHEDEPKPPTSLDAGAIDKYLAAEVAHGDFVGLSVAILRDGKLVLANGYGKASREAGTPVTRDTPFAIGSITKQFTCAAALLLQEEGKLSLDDKVSRHIPRLTRGDDITLGDLGAHVSGYPDYYPLDFMDDRFRHATTGENIVRTYATGKLDFEPRTRWSYSNTGFILLGRVIEQATLEPLAEVFHHRIFGPVGMGHAWLEPNMDAPTIARGYTSFALGEPQQAEHEQPGWLGAAGGIVTTAPDLVLWDMALMDGKLLKPESWKRMSTPVTLADGHSTGYGCGLGTRQQHDETLYGHTGAVNGYLASNTFIPRTRSALVILSNYDGAPIAHLRQTLLKLLLEAGDPPPPHPAGSPATDVARSLFHELQTGSVDRTRLGEDYAAYLTEARLHEAASRLAPLGDPRSVEVESTSERGGMEVTSLRFSFDRTKLSASMFRSTDGKVQQFLVTKQ